MGVKDRYRQEQINQISTKKKGKKDKVRSAFIKAIRAKTREIPEPLREPGGISKPIKDLGEQER